MVKPEFLKCRAPYRFKRERSRCSISVNKKQSRFLVGARSQPLFRALERVIPDIRQRIVLELIGTPLTHAHYLRRYKGTYGLAIAAGKGMFPSCQTPIAGLYRVGDSTMPGIGVPAVAASGILCANTLVTPQQTSELMGSLSKK